MHTPPVAIAITMVLLAALGAACGDDAAPSATVPSETVPPETAPSETVPSKTVPSKTGSPSLETSGSETFPITVEHAFGVTVVPAEPQRVVTVGVTEHDTVLALGVTPVGVTDWYGDQPFATWPWAQDELGGAEPEVLSSADGLQYERIAALEPDLIIGTNAGLDDAMYEQLSAIAPTIAHPAGTDAYFSPWDQQALLVGQALGREPEVRAHHRRSEGRVRRGRRRAPRVRGDRHRVPAERLLRRRGDRLPGRPQHRLSHRPRLHDPIRARRVRARGGAQAYIPLEQLSVLDTADVLLWATEAPGDRAALEAEPLYSSLAAVEDGHLVFTDGITAGAIYFTSLLSLPFVLEHLVPALASTVAGDGPATIDAS